MLGGIEARGGLCRTGQVAIAQVKQVHLNLLAARADDLGERVVCRQQANVASRPALRQEAQHGDGETRGRRGGVNGERRMVNRKTNREAHRIFHPRLSIAGYLPPSVLDGTLTKVFFQRGLPAQILFGSLQRITAEQTDLNPVLMCAANSTGGVMGKMVDAQSIVVASTVTNWYGHEGSLQCYVFWHSLALAALVGVLVSLQAYVPPFTGMVVK